MEGSTLNKQIKTKLSPLDELYSLKEALKSLIDKDEEEHIMDKTFSDSDQEKLNEAYEIMSEIYDYDPTPQNLWDHSGGEPPVTLAEMHEQAFKEKYG
tara:strand:+ start:338 stop:631 length:294 start_codon:yes stop_codon:yes gene_type:complete